MSNVVDEVNEICIDFEELSILANNAGVEAMNDDKGHDYKEILQMNQLSHYLVTRLLFTSKQRAENAGNGVRIFHQAPGTGNRSAGKLKYK